MAKQQSSFRKQTASIVADWPTDVPVTQLCKDIFRHQKCVGMLMSFKGGTSDLKLPNNVAHYCHIVSIYWERLGILRQI